MIKGEFHQARAQAAVIYCRVSSVKQRLEGSGLESQEQRCCGSACKIDPHLGVIGVQK